MALAYIAAGVYHIVNPNPYLAIMPPWLPMHALFVLVSGIIEILLGFLLLWPRTRKFAAWGLVILLIAVFPANVQMMINYKAQSNPRFWLSVLRLPIQPLLIWWAYQYTRTPVLSNSRTPYPIAE